MKRKLILYTLIILLTVACIYASGNEKYAGFRASRILSSYPNRQFPTPQYWEGAAKQMAGNFDGFEPAGLWIVSLFLSDPDGYTMLNFPSDGLSPDSVIFRSSDQNEAWLNHFDTTGVKVWLQVEPGGADIDTLISIVLNRYKHHPCVIGFGVDVEWYQTNTHSGGRKVSNSEAQQWENKVKSIDSTYTLFLKHYSKSWMPSSYRGDIWFVDDSQDFNWGSNPIDLMVNEFRSWGQQFSPNPVAFQFGYPNDENWWSSYNNPPDYIGDRLKNQISNCRGLFWVDFTITDVLTELNHNGSTPSSFILGQNYPNPFNPSTTIPFSIPQNCYVSVDIFDMNGKMVKVFPDQYKQAGHYELQWNAGDLPSGVYYYRLSAGNEQLIGKCVLLK